MSSERSASSAACRLSASRIGIALSVSFSIPGIQPTVEIAVRRCVIPISGSRSAAARTASMFIIGSPIPMKTRWLSVARRRKWRTWSTISSVVRLRPKRIEPVAQNVHVSGQPDWEETQTERRPSR